MSVPHVPSPALRVEDPSRPNSPLMAIVREENVHNMELRPGKGNEPDALNVVWVMNSDRLPFYRAERYHQFHRGLGNKVFGPEYLNGLREVQDKLGRSQGGTRSPLKSRVA